MEPKGTSPAVHPLSHGGDTWTIMRLVRWCADYLGGKGVPGARLDCEHLLADTLGIDRLDLYLQFDRPLTADELARFKARLVRRAKREPVQYILGRTGFRELDLVTDRRVLIPRPETESLVEEVLRWARLRSASGLSALDLGTGSGAIGLSLLKEGPFAHVVATDCSPGALEVARENARRLELVASVDLRLGNLFGPLKEDERFDVVVSNPPYVSDSEFERDLAPELVRWEPRLALVAGPTGLEAIEGIVRGSPRFLVAGGLLALEIGETQGEEGRRVAEGVSGLTAVKIHQDLTGRDRVLTAERRG